MLIQEFDTQMSRLMGIYGNQKPAVVQDYWKFLKHIEAPQFEKMVDDIILQYDPMGKKFPRIPFILSFKKQVEVNPEEKEWNCPENERATHADTNEFFLVLEEIGEWINAKIGTYNEIYNHFSTGLAMHYDKPTFAKYCSEYKMLLREKRQERMKA